MKRLKENKQNVLTIKNDVRINKDIILEKGDKIQVLKDSRYHENSRRDWWDKEIPYKGFIIFVKKQHTRFGLLYHAENNIGEPYRENSAYQTEKEAVDIEKKNIDIYIKETGGDYR